MELLFVSGLTVIMFIAGLYLLNIITSIWAYRDARSRGRSREFCLLVLVATLIFPILGLIIYLIVRND
ncbi:PLDc N-terminal domain-containing protein [Paenibacillus tarimensis]|nr:PLDc N-terminal domain-containing protein [Paenibacillus tarimensis]MCF2943922.1 PLDc N-terminal domain-containing protein [Paenibacillus tarimensis]